MVLKNEVSQKANIIYLPSCLQSSAPLTNITVSFYYKQRYNQDIYHNKHNSLFMIIITLVIWTIKNTIQHLTESKYTT